MAIPESYKSNYGYPDIEEIAMELFQAVIDDNEDKAQELIDNLDRKLDYGGLELSSDVNYAFTCGLALSFIYNREEIALSLLNKGYVEQAIGYAIRDSSNKEQTFNYIVKFLDENPQMLSMKYLRAAKRDITDDYLPELLLQQIGLFPDLWNLEKVQEQQEYFSEKHFSNTAQVLDLYLDKMQKLP